MSFPIKLEGLSQRDQIADALYRVCQGIDANNYELCKSGFPSDGKCSFVIGGRSIDGLDAIKTDVFDRVGPMDTTHILSCLRIDYKDGADKASLTCSAIAQHGQAGNGQDGAAARFMSGGIYFVDLIKEGGEWKITRWELDAKWFQGDRSVMGH